MTTRFFINIITSVLFIILVFMNFLGYWNANLVVQVIFFVAMVSAIFNAGTEYGKRNHKV